MKGFGLFLLVVLPWFGSGCTSSCDLDARFFQVSFEGYTESELEGLTILKFRLPTEALMDSSQASVFPMSADSLDFGLAASITPDKSVFYLLRLQTGEEHIIGGFAFHKEDCNDSPFSNSTFDVLDSFVLDGERIQGSQVFEARIRK